MTARLSRPRRRVLELAREGVLRRATDGRVYAVGGESFSRQSLAAARRAGEVALNVVTGLLYLTDHGREVLRREEGQAPRKVFTCSWSDWFHKDADRWRDEAWDVIRRTPQHTYLVLTKRPERIADHLPDDWGDGWPNVWLGVSIENRQFVHRADVLRAVPAAVRFISAEPLLGPLVCLDLRGIDWLIAGGESGSRPGRMLVERDDAGRWVPKPDALRWVRDLRDACERAETAFLFKQWGGPRPTSGGRLLDGRTWDEMPATRPVEVER